MALSAAFILEVRNGGSATAGGGFKTGATGTDWGQQNSPQYSVTDGVTAGTTTITSVTANFGTDVVGNLMYVQGGTGTIVAGWYEITVRNSATSITVDRSTGLTIGTGATLHIGGALNDPGLASSIAIVSGQLIYVKYNVTDYTITTATTGTGGPVTLAAGVSMIGYDVTRNDATGNRPCLNWGAVSAPGSLAYLYTAAATSSSRAFINLKANGNHVAKVGGLTLFGATNPSMIIHNCVAINCDGSTGVGINCDATGVISDCMVDSCTVGIQPGAGIAIRCLVSNSVTSYLLGITGGTAIQCIGYASSSIDFSSTASGTSYFGCVSYGASNAWSCGNLRADMLDCVAVGYTGYAYTGAANAKIITFATYAASPTGRLNGAPLLDYQAITMSADPFTSGTDFRPNATASAGALLRSLGIGIPGQTNNFDVGALHHSDSPSYSRARRGV